MSFLLSLLVAGSMSMFLYMSGLIFLGGLISFSSNRKHLLAALLSIEFIMLSLFWIVSLLMMKFVYVSFISLVFLTFIVCEASLGLSLLVCLIRSHGVDFFDMMNVLVC
nr:NADH dehydrogenase subunit 4L [Halicryptus spinulosus]